MFTCLLLLTACTETSKQNVFDNEGQVLEVMETPVLEQKYEWFDIVSDFDEVPIYHVDHIVTEGRTIKDLFENEQYIKKVYENLVEVDDSNGIVETLRQGMLNYDIRLGILFKGEVVDFEQLVAEAYYSNPMIIGTVAYLFFAKEQLEEGSFLHFELVYTTNQNEMEMVYPKVEEFYAKLPLEGKSVDKKISIIHRAVIEQIEYVNAGNMRAHAPYGFFILGEGVYQAYAIAMQILLEKAGIESHFVVGYKLDSPEKEPHAWNLVKTELGWRHIDATNNDLGERYEDQVSLFYYKMTDEVAKQYYVWDERFYPQSRINESF